jgi:type III secretion protein T
MNFSTAILALEPLHIYVIAATVGVARMIGLMTIMALYFASGCFQLTLRAVYDSYRTSPADRFTPMFNSETGDALLGLLDRIVSAGFQLAAPLVALMLLCDLSIGLLARSAPSTQLYSLAPLVKNLLFTVMVLLYFAFLTRYMDSSLAILLDRGKLLVTMAGRR